MQRKYSSSENYKFHFLALISFHVRDRTACLNSFCVVAYKQHKRVSSDSPTLKLKKCVPGRECTFLVLGERPTEYLIFYPNRLSKF